MLPSELNQDFAAQRRAMMDTRRLRERATGDSLLGIVQEAQGWTVARLENDQPGAVRERLQGNFESVQVALKAAKRIQNKTREDIKIIREEQQIRDMLAESLMRAEFPTAQDAGVFMFQAGSTGKKLARFPSTLPKKVGRRFEVEFLATRSNAGKLSDIARKSNGKLSFAG